MEYITILLNLLIMGGFAYGFYISYREHVCLSSAGKVGVCRVSYHGGIVLKSNNAGES